MKNCDPSPEEKKRESQRKTSSTRARKKRKKPGKHKPYRRPNEELKKD